VLGDSVSALGFQIAFYYGLTGLACVVYYRRALLRSASGFVFGGVLLMLWPGPATAASSAAASRWRRPTRSSDRPQPTRSRPSCRRPRGSPERGEHGAVLTSTHGASERQDG
jgi:hypothetical protein